jgi:hypothetical protein
MGFQSIFAWKALPEAAFVKKAVIDAHRSKHESIASGWLHRSARPILPQASPVWKVWNLPDCFLRARESVRRASGFVQTGFWEVRRDGQYPTGIFGAEVEGHNPWTREKQQKHHVS